MITLLTLYPFFLFTRAVMEEIVDGSENFHVKLIDFGYSRAFSESRKMLSFV